MPTGIYQDANPNSKVSTGDNLNPIIFKASNVGGTEERQLFLRHPILAGDGAEFSADVTVDPVDISTGEDDVQSWIQVAPDNSGSPGVYGAAGAAVNLGNVNLGETVPFWIKATIPSNLEVGAREDLKLRVTSAETNTNVLDIDLEAGTFHEDCFFDTGSGRLGLVYSNPGHYGYFLSEWMNVSNASALSGVSYTPEGGTAYFSYRTADDDAGTNASDWVYDPEDVDLSTQDYLQVRIEMYGQEMPYYSSGLTRYVHSGTGFNNLQYTTYGYVPYSSSPASPYYTGNYSLECYGQIYLPTSGNYVFQVESDDLGQVYIDGNLMVSVSVGTSNSLSTYFDAGYHSIRVRHNQGSGGYYYYLRITPPGEAQRAVVASDFVDDRWVGSEAKSYVGDVSILYTGPYEEDYDIRFYLGPATPELIDPEDAFQTQDFNPILTAVSAQCDYIQFQLDNVNTFDSSNLQTWEIPATNDINASSQSPVFDRPSGVWYWRARAKYDGYYGNWSDYRNFTILPFETFPQFIYLNVNVGFEIPDVDYTYKHYYLNVNTGDREVGLYVTRHVYLNVNTGVGVGEVIYPIFDKTPPRKQTFDGDGDMF